MSAISRMHSSLFMKSDLFIESFLFNILHRNYIQKKKNIAKVSYGKEERVMRNPNRYGTVRKLSGNRRRPFGVYITTGIEVAHKVPSMDFMEDILPEDLYNQVREVYDAYVEKQPKVGRQIQKCIGYYPTRQDALIALAEYNKNPFDIDKREITFKQVYDAIHDRDIKSMKPSAKRAYETAHDKCGSLDQMRIRDIKLAHLQRVVDQHADKSKSTQNNIVVLFHTIYKFCMENDLAEKDYSSFVKITSKAEKKQKQPYSKDEVKKIWDNLDWQKPSQKRGPLTGVSFADSLLVMIFTGVRIGELLDIRVSDVHLEERWIEVKGTKTKAAQRIVPIHQKIIPLIEKRVNEAKGEYLFGDKNGGQLTYNQFKKSFFVDYMECFGMNHTPHECRHTFASVAAASGMNPILVKKIIGHASSDITENVYTHAYIEDLVAEIDKFNL